MRRSTDDEHQPYSLEAQLARLHAYVASQPGWVLVDTFCDNASAATTNRPGLQATLAAARSHRFDLLLVYRLDRFTRRIRDLAVLIEELDTTGVAFRSATEPFDTASPAGRMLVQMLAVFAEFEREILIDRITSGLERKAARGQWAGGVPPYGYHVDPDTHRLTENPNEAAILREIFQQYVSTRAGTRALATALNQRGLRTRAGRLWSGHTIVGMLTNRVYLGELHYRTISLPHAHPPLITTDQYTNAQHTLAVHGHPRPLPTTAGAVYHLTGLITCPNCGHKYVGTSAHGRHHTYRYYTCIRRSRYGPAVCAAPRLPADTTDELILTALVDFYTHTAAFSELLSDAVGTAQRQSEISPDTRREEQVTLQRELIHVTDALDRYLTAFEHGTLDETTCGHRVRTLHQREKQLTHRIDEITTTDLPPTTPNLPVDRIHNQIAAILHTATPAQRVAIIQTHITEIRVTSGTITPIFKLPPASPPPDRPTCGEEPADRGGAQTGARSWSG